MRTRPRSSVKALTRAVIESLPIIEALFLLYETTLREDEFLPHEWAH